MIKYNESVEVTEKQYKAVLKTFTGLVAHRTATIEGVKKYFIKVWYPKFVVLVHATIEENK